MFYYWYMKKNFLSLPPWHVYLVYQYLHMYPKIRQCKTIFGISASSFKEIFYPTIEAMATRINELDYILRLSPYNHVYHYPSRVTAIVDTYVVHVSCPSQGRLARALYNPKYGGFVLKWQVVVDFLGNFLLVTGPHVAYDGHIFNYTTNLHPMYPWELWLGDGHYIGLPTVISPYRRDHPLTEGEVKYNLIHSFYRSRVEQSIHRIKFHNIFSNVYRGSWEVLDWAMKIVVHTTQVENRLRPKYALFGPWYHDL